STSELRPGSPNKRPLLTRNPEARSRREFIVGESGFRPTGRTRRPSDQPWTQIASSSAYPFLPLPYNETFAMPATLAQILATTRRPPRLRKHEPSVPAQRLHSRRASDRRSPRPSR